MTTVQDLLTLQLKDAGVVGVGQTPLYEDINDALTRLNQMIGQWSTRKFFMWHLNEYSVVSTGANTYTVGPGGAFNVPVVPNVLDSAFLRQLVTSAPNQVDWPLAILYAVEDYNRIALKQLSAFTRYLFYDYSWENGTGTLKPWPVAQANIYEYHIFVKAQLQAFTSLTQTINLPAEYNACIHWNMVKRIKTAYQMPADMDVNQLAQDAIDVVEGANFQIPTMTLPTDLLRPGIYDPYSDQTY